MHRLLLNILSLTAFVTASPLTLDPSTHKTRSNIYTRQAAPTLPFNLTYAFTANLKLGTPNQPIPIPGGILLTEPISSGVVSGPLINATVQGGLAVPYVYNNQTLQVPRISIYGITSDGRSFFVEEAGIGRPNGQVTRITLSINTTGNAGYEKLVDGFILASVNPNRNATEVQVEGWIVENDTAFMG